MKYLKVLGLAAALATLPALSHAEWGYTAADADLMAGPAPGRRACRPPLTPASEEEERGGSRMALS